MRNAVESGLLPIADRTEDLPDRVLRLRREIEAAQILLVEIDVAQKDLAQQSKAEREALESSVGDTSEQLKEVDRQLSTAKGSAETLTIQIQQLSGELKAATKDVTEYSSRGEKLSKKLRYQQSQILESISKQTKALSAAEERRKAQVGLIASLSAGLADAENALAAAENAVTQTECEKSQH